MSSATAAERYETQTIRKVVTNDAIRVALLLPSTSSLLAASTPIRPDASAKLVPCAQRPDSRRM